MTGDRPWLSPGRPPWIPRRRIMPVLHRVLIVGAFLILHPIDGTRIVTGVLAEYRADADS